VEQYVHYVYDFLGDKRVDSVIDVDRVLDASPTLQKTVDSLWTRALRAAESKDEPWEICSLDFPLSGSEFLLAGANDTLQVHSYSLSLPL
jgi:hypothetical protein